MSERDVYTERELWIDGVLAGLFVGCTFVAASLVALVIMSCKAASPTTPLDRDGAGTPLGAACEALRTFGCPEAEPGAGGETCFERLGREASVIVIPADCVADAGNAEVLRGCGSANTLRFRCLIPDGGAR